MAAYDLETQMLVLTRKLGASLLLGDNIEIRILGILGNQVRIGINAPKGIAVDREEIHLRKLADRMRSIAPPEKAPSDRKPTIILKKSKLCPENVTPVLEIPDQSDDC